MVEAVPDQRKQRVRVVVADDHPLYREGVVRALSASGQVEIVAEAEDGRSALAEIQQHRPDVALLDYKLPELDGVAVTNAVVRHEPGPTLSSFTTISSSASAELAIAPALASAATALAASRTIGLPASGSSTAVGASGPSTACRDGGLEVGQHAVRQRIVAMRVRCSIGGRGLSRSRSCMKTQEWRPLALGGMGAVALHGLPKSGNCSGTWVDRSRRESID